MYVPGADARRRAAAPARDLLRHDRLRDRAHRLAPPARCGCARRSSRARSARRSRPTSRRRCCERLTEVDALERFMHKAYLGQKQFSIEGLDMTVPMLDELIQLAGRPRRARGRDRHGPPRPAQRARPQPRPPVRLDLRRVRGRLDARADHHDPAGRHRRRQVPPRRPGLLPAARAASRSSSAWSPTRRTSSSSRPVAAGATRAAQTTRQGPHAHQRHQRRRSRSILHGDAAFPGQGVVAETLNLQALDGYTVGGTIHLIQNNQVGFTTDPDDARSTRWASDLAKGFDVPIIHVNADDVAGLHQRRAARVRVPPGVRPRRADRPDRLPPLRPQRGRRARLHAARDVPGDQEAPAGARAVRARS